MPSTPIDSLVHDYFDCLNERDADRRAELVRRVWADGGVFGVPLAQADGHDGIAALIAGVQAQIPGYVVRRTTPIDTYGNAARFGFVIFVDEQPVVVGTDFVVLTGDKFQITMGFFDSAELASSS